ncbi:efflux RND transporter permease subunit [Amycolatopsis sp. NPDC058278]|uniref:efflux RND transporter permease subunit n=1 Tax=Amycolatopsis sp. NPDC058278 TaxID=3346417 RepID=UPI0036D782BE
MRAKADEVKNAIAGVAGTVDAKVELQQDEPQLQVTVKLDEAQKHGLKPSDARWAAGTLIAGEEVGDIYRGGKTYDVQVWSTPQVRHSVTDVRNLLLDKPSGGQVERGRHRGRRPRPGARHDQARERRAPHRRHGGDVRS